MSFIETIYEKAKANPQRVVVPECTNPSMMRAAVKAASDGLAKITFVGDAENCKKYLSTKFTRFLLLQCLSSINIAKDKFTFVPMQDFPKPWTDEELYAKYNLTQEEIDFIESMIKPMGD